jgi:hypothetical protein
MPSSLTSPHSAPTCHAGPPRCCIICGRSAEKEMSFVSNLLEYLANFRSWRKAQSSIRIQEGEPNAFSAGVRRRSHTTARSAKALEWPTFLRSLLAVHIWFSHPGSRTTLLAFSLAFAERPPRGRIRTREMLRSCGIQIRGATTFPWKWFERKERPKAIWSTGVFSCRPCPNCFRTRCPSSC